MAAQRLAGLRVNGGVAVEADSEGGLTRLVSVHEAGGYKARFPLDREGLEVALINTGGGIAGGDQVAFSIEARGAAAVTISTPAAERIYRALDAPAVVNVRLMANDSARLAWMPQESILYNGARLERHIEADVAPTARLLISEMLVLGRTARSERLEEARLTDRWRVRRGGKLVLVEAVRLDGPLSRLMEMPAIGNGASSAATIAYIAANAEDRLACVREALASAPCPAAASAWNGMLVARFLATSSAMLRKAVASAIVVLDGRPMPRVWAT